MTTSDDQTRDEAAAAMDTAQTDLDTARETLAEAQEVGDTEAEAEATTLVDACEAHAAACEAALDAATERAARVDEDTPTVLSAEAMATAMEIPAPPARQGTAAGNRAAKVEREKCLYIIPTRPGSTDRARKRSGIAVEIMDYYPRHGESMAVHTYKEAVRAHYTDKLGRTWEDGDKKANDAVIYDVKAGLIHVVDSDGVAVSLDALKSGYVK